MDYGGNPRGPSLRTPGPVLGPSQLGKPGAGACVGEGRWAGTGALLLAESALQTPVLPSLGG